MSILHLFVFVFLAIASPSAEPLFRAGVAVVDISPTNFPVIVNAMFTERSAAGTVDPLEVRALVLDDGTNQLAFAIVDTCMMPRELIDRAKKIAREQTGIPSSRMLVSATHTHSAPAAMGCLGSRADTNYAAFLPGRIAEAIARAADSRRPAQIGWTVVDDWEHTFNRRWIRRPDRLLEDPFGGKTVRAHMHPGNESKDVTGPSGPVDPALSVIGLRTREGQPLAILANYSQHYYGSPLLSSDYFGRFARQVGPMIGATNAEFVAMMSQGTSGDLMWMDYSAPRKEIGYDAYAREMAERAREAWRKINFADWVPLNSAETTLKLKYRVPDASRLERSRQIAEGLGGRLPQTLPEIYALEAIYLHERPETELLLQALRIGDLGIAAFPNEVYALTGLKVKARSPFSTTINLGLANGAEGYIPPPEQHQLGGYTTWPARTAGLEIEAEGKIVETLLTLLGAMSDGATERPHGPDGRYTRGILSSKPVAYYRLDEMSGDTAVDAAHAELPEGARNARFEGAVAFYLPGVGSGEGFSPEPALKPSSFSKSGGINRAVHLAGGWLEASLPVRGNYSVSFWFWNGLESSAREVTGVLFSRGSIQTRDQLSIAGRTASRPGRLIFTGESDGQTVHLTGQREIPLRQWHHLALVRDGETIAIYLNGKRELEGKTTSPAAHDGAFRLGATSDRQHSFEGKLDEVAVYDRALSAEEIAAQLAAAEIRF